MNFNRNNVEIQTKNFGLKIENKRGVPPCLFSIFLPKNFYLKFHYITIGISRGILKLIENVVRCLINWLITPKMRM